MKKKKKQNVKVTMTVGKELTGIDIAKYLLSIGPYKDEDKTENKKATQNE